jgi:ATP-dependent helicase/DNAse subunit B
MSSHVTVLTGLPLCGKTELLLEQYRARLKENEPGVALWIAPTFRAAAAVRDRLLSESLSGCFRPDVMTFAKFAGAVLEASPDPIRPLTGSMKRQLVRQLLDEQNDAGRLNHFRPIVHTSGLVDLVGEFIGELKRLEIWPEHFREACQARGIAPKDEELLEIYELYQEALRVNQLFDAEGSFWSARNWLDRGQRRPFEHLRFVVVDGFSDFTRTQHEILQILAGRVESLCISLTLEPPPCREDLFAKPMKTLDELRRRHPGLEVREIECLAAIGHQPKVGRGASRDLMDHLKHHLFGNPRKAKEAESCEGVEILAAARPIGEMEMIAERIKRLMVEEGVKADDIAVVFRSPQDSGTLAAEVFDRYGLPVAFESGVKLDRSPILRSLAALLKLDLDDWPFGSLLAVLGSNYFQPVALVSRGSRTLFDLEREIRELQIPQGREKLLEAVRGIDAESPDETAQREIKPSNILKILEDLVRAFDELPRKATLPDWAKAWEKLARRTGMLGVIEENGSDADDPHLTAIRRSDAGAWHRLMSDLVSGDTLAGWLGRRPREFDRQEAFSALIDILGSARLSSGEEESGRVRVLSAPSVRSLHMPYLFVAGLSETAFPQPDREDRLYGETEYLRLIEEGLPLVARTERNREEMLLFYETITRATERLYLSYPALDDKAQSLSPSPFLLEVEQACGKGKLVRTEATDFRPVRKTAQPLSASEFRVAAMAEAIEGNFHWLAGLRTGATSLGAGATAGSSSSAEVLAKGRTAGRASSGTHAAQNLFAGLELTMMRADRERFGAAEGVLLGAAAKRRLKAEFPASRTFGVTELENYARCPYRFLMERILKIEPIEDIALETDYLERGQSVHEVLAAFHRRVNEHFGRPTSPAKLDEPEFNQLMQEAMAEGLPQPSANPVRAALQEIDRRMIAKWLADYRRQHEEYDKLLADCQSPPAPEFFEISFGNAKHTGATWAIEEPYIIVDGGNEIRLSGRIDRVDTGFAAGHVVFNVLDYKTGPTAKFSYDEFQFGTALQLPVYIMAAMELFLNDRNPFPLRAGYWLVAKNGFNERQSIKTYRSGESGREEIDEEWERVRDQLEEIVAGLVHGLKSGFFPVFNRNDRCTGSCPMSTICRINHIRSLEKTCVPMVE